MHFKKEIRYTEDNPPMAVLDEGGYLLTTLVADVPVTYIMVAEILGAFRWVVRETQQYVNFRGECTVKVEPNGFQMEKFIGEKMILFQSLDTLHSNSTDAGATKFVIEIIADETHVTFLIKDDGVGVHPSVESLILKEFVTTKGSGLSAGLRLADFALKRIGATLTYEGKANLPGAEKPGAKFKITFLKEMPVAI